MVRLALATAAALSLAACYNPRYPSEAPGHDRPEQPPVTQGSPVNTAPAVTSGSGAPVTSAADNGVPGVLRPGYGVIESVALLLPAGSAAAGGTTVTPRGYDLRIRMDDGTAQNLVLQEASTFRVGDRVEVTSTGALIRR